LNTIRSLLKRIFKGAPGVFLGVLLASMAGLAQAADTQGFGAHRLRALLEQSVLQHPSVLQARGQARAAGFELDSANWLRFPTLSAEARVEKGTNQNVAKGEQPLWSGGRITAQIELAQANQRMAMASVQDAELTVLTQLASAFLESLRLEARLQTAAHNIAEHERLLRLIQRRVQAEISPLADETLAQARLQQALSERIQLQRQRDAARLSVNQWSGMQISGALAAPKALVFTRPGSSALIQDKALAYSPQRSRLRAQIEIAEAQIQVSKSATSPTVVAGYQYTWDSTLSGANNNRAYLALQFQPGAGLSALSNAQIAVARKEASQQELEALELNLSNQVLSAVSELDTMFAQLGPARALLSGTTEVVESYLRQYQIGRKNWLDVLNAQREMTQALYNVADMEFGHQLAQMKLMLLTGDITGQQLSAIHD
jgi:adhesin transport system outer membrane protein